MKKIVEKLLLLSLLFCFSQVSMADNTDLFSNTFDNNGSNEGRSSGEGVNSPSVMNDGMLYENVISNYSDINAMGMESFEHKVILSDSFTPGMICPRCGGSMTTNPCTNMILSPWGAEPCGYQVGNGESSTGELPGSPVGDGVYALLLAGVFYVGIILYRRITRKRTEVLGPVAN